MQRKSVNAAYKRDEKHDTTAFLLCFFFGVFGGHRMYLGEWAAASRRLVLPLIIATLMLLGVTQVLPASVVIGLLIPFVLAALIWEIIDLFRIDHEVYERNLALAERLIAGAVLSDPAVVRSALDKMEGEMQTAHDAATASATREENATTFVAAAATVSALPEPAADVPAQAESAAIAETGDGAAVTTGAGYAAISYVATTTTELGEPADIVAATNTDTSEEWSETRTWTNHAEESRTASAAELESARADDMRRTDEDAIQATDASGVDIEENVTLEHRQTPWSTTDSVETGMAVGIARTREMAEEETTEEDTNPSLLAVSAEDDTWPGSGAAARRANTGGLVASAGWVAVDDASDSARPDAAATPIADVEPGTGPMHVVLPDQFVETEDQPLVEPALTEEEEWQLLLEEEAAQQRDGETFLPPVVPLVTAAETEPIVHGALEAAMSSPSGAIPVVTTDEDLAASSESAPELAAAAVEEPTQQGQAGAEPSHADAAAVPTGAAAEIAPVSEWHSQPDRVETAERADETAQADQRDTGGFTATGPEAAANPHRVRRIREVLEVRRDNALLRELSAEEYIEIDDDPEPVRVRLRQELHRQAADLLESAN